MKACGGRTRRHQKGSAVIFIVAWLVFAILALDAWSLFEGQAGIARMQARFQADAVARGAGIASRVYGPTLRCQAGYGFEYLEFLHTFNGGSDAFECPLIGSSPTIEPEETVSYGFATEESQTASGAFGGLMNYTGAASRQAHVSTINEKNVRETYVKNRPNVVLVLDYSTSMVTRDSGYTETRQQRLKSIINFLLDTLPIRAEFLGDDKELFVDNVDLGVVLFAGTAFESVAIDKGEDVKEEIRALLDSPLREDTNIDAAFQTAAALFQAHDDGDDNLVIFVSDGSPTVGSTNQPYSDAINAYNNVLKPLVSNVFALLWAAKIITDPDLTALGLNIAQFMELISTMLNLQLGMHDDNLDFGEYFEDFEIFFFVGQVR